MNLNNNLMTVLHHKCNSANSTFSVEDDEVIRRTFHFILKNRFINCITMSDYVCIIQQMAPQNRSEWCEVELWYDM